jgi:hypothetical protein
LLRPPPSAGGSFVASFGLKLFIEAQASISVPSTEKWSVLKQALHARLRQNPAQQLGGDVASHSRSRFLENVE